MNWSEEQLAELYYPPLVRQVAKQRREVAEAFATIKELGFSEAGHVMAT